MNRRDFLKSMMCASALVAVPSLARSDEMSLSDWLDRAFTRPNPLWLRRGNDILAFDCSTEQGYRAACWLLRDVQAGVTGFASPRLLQGLSWMQSWLAVQGYHAPIVAHSGLRTRSTNNKTEGAALGSRHLPDQYHQFHATDWHIDGIGSEYLGRLAAMTRTGGVGFYNARNFVHTDDGPIRYWRSRK